ncbi:MAG TPA: magnesium transporter [Ktedonobacterales bacterium]|jgi:Mg2+ transporter MgtE
MAMIFLSNLLRRTVYDSNNQRIGALRDLYVSLHDVFPRVTALAVKPAVFGEGAAASAGARGNGGTGAALFGQEIIIPWEYVSNLEDERIYLTAPADRVEPLPHGSHIGDLRLARDLLDKQIVDTQGFRVVKVNDLKLAQIRDTARLVGADISLRALLRRLGAETPAVALSRVLPIKLPERTITWNYVEPIEAAEPALAPAGAAASAGNSAADTRSSGTISVPAVRLSVSHAKLAELHPADIADILEQLNVAEGGAILEELDTETAADALEEVEPTRQAALVSELDPERASDLLERIAPDNAADILGELDEQAAARLLDLMPTEESQPIRDLLRYEEQSAGGIMTTEVLSLPSSLTAAETLERLRTQGRELEMVYYLYVVDDERHLVGVVSLRQLVTSSPETRLEAIMDPDVFHVHVNDDQEEVAHIIAKYDLLGLPVVDEDERLVGLITVDDIIDVLDEEHTEDVAELAGTSAADHPEEAFSWRGALNRSGWLAVNLVIGILAAFVLRGLLESSLGGHAGGTSEATSGLIAFVPLLLFTSGGIGAQELGIAGWVLRDRRGRAFWRIFFRELRLGTLGGLLASVVVGVISGALFGNPLLGLALGLGTGITLLIAAICGLALPAVLAQVRLRGSFIAAPLLDPVIAVISLAIFLSTALYLMQRFNI